MLRKAAAAIAILSSAATLVSAAITFDTPGNTSLKQEIAALDLSVPQAAPVADQAALPSKAAAKEWTVMVFINGKNNLEPFALKDMNEMEQVGSTDKVNVVTETGLVSGYGDTPWLGTRRFLIQKDNDTNTVTSQMVQDMGKVDMGDYNSVIDFVKWAKTNYPAKKYMLVIWNHGSGWDKSVRANITKGISYDDETNNHISTPQLGQILKQSGGVDVYGSDACLMQMAEVVYELKDNVQYIVGSEETEPGDGYTYNDLLGPLAANPAMSAEELGKTAVDAYANHYQSTNEGSTQSLVKTAAIPQFTTLMNNFATALMGSNDKAGVKKAISSAQSFAVSDNHDIWHFADLISKSTKSSAVKSSAAALKTYITGTLILNNRPTGNYSNAHGIAAYMPSYGFNSDYNDLAWASAGQWDEFIKWYQGK
jgi:hypothetical protein